jgi:hypothetical protein
MSGSPLTVRRQVQARIRSLDRVSTALAVVFVSSAAFYVWTAGTSVALSLHGGLGDRYNLLATAFLHFRLSIGTAPAALMHLSDPYNPVLNRQALNGINDASNLNDDVLYHGQLYFLWGPAPALVLLVPLHLLGLEPSASVTVAVYGIFGLGFALAALRVVLRQVGETPMWMCVLAGYALAFSSAVPFILRTPSVTEDVLAGGYCFTMAGIWLAASALVDRRASLLRLGLMSLCFGLAAGSRPPLGLTALVLLPVYVALRRSRPRRGLLLSLGLPVGVCLALLLAYNQARFHQPLEIGTRYQLSGLDSPTAPLGRLSYVLPGAGFYGLTPPRARILFPFIGLARPRLSSPAGLALPEATGGLLPMAPVVIFLAALPWIWRRRPRLLGRLAAPLGILAGVGAGIALLASYEFYSPTERYEVDFFTLFVLAALAVWLALSRESDRYLRRLCRVGGGLLVVWGCAAGLAVSFTGQGDSLADEHPGTWGALEDGTSPISTAIAEAVGHPVLASMSYVLGTEVGESTNLGVGFTEFVLSPVDRARVTIVSPGARGAALTADIGARAGLRSGARYDVLIDGPGHVSHSYSISDGSEHVNMPIRLDRGLNHLTFRLVAASRTEKGSADPRILVQGLSLASV